MGRACTGSHTAGVVLDHLSQTNSIDIRENLFDGRQINLSKSERQPQKSKFSCTATDMGGQGGAERGQDLGTIHNQKDKPAVVRARPLLRLVQPDS